MAVSALAWSGSIPDFESNVALVDVVVLDLWGVKAVIARAVLDGIARHNASAVERARKKAHAEPAPASVEKPAKNPRKKQPLAPAETLFEETSP